MQLILDIFYRLIAAWSSWCFALALIRLKRAKVLLCSGLIALACGILTLCLEQMGRADLLFLAETGLFALAAIAVQLSMGGAHANAAFAFLLAQSGNAVLHLTLPGAVTGDRMAAVILAAVFLIAFWGVGLCLRQRLPRADWQSCFADEAQEAGRLPLRLSHVYGTAAGVCLLLTAGALLLHPDTLTEAAVWGGIAFALFWLSVCLLILMTVYKEERITALAERQYRDEMQSFMNVIRSQRHDYNFHVGTIAGLIREGKIEECRKYVSALERDSALMNALLPVKDPAISATILNFQTLAAREGIELHIDIQNDLSQIATNVYETNKIISNLLQNAIDEVSTHRDKTYGIWLTILKRGEYCVIRVSNEVESRTVTAEELGQFYRQGYTTKRGHDGVGLSGIQVLASRYRGGIYTQVEGNVLHFLAKIPINYAKETD